MQQGYFNVKCGYFSVKCACKNDFFVGLYGYSLKNLIAKKWALSRVTLFSGVCEQQRRRPACASAQSDQRLCNSLSGKYHI